VPHAHRLLADAGAKDCDHCGTYCQWDAESEWQGMWQDWERKLAYYDRSYGKLMDNWWVPAHALLHEKARGVGQVALAAAKTTGPRFLA
jgi:hypothetical protein